MIGYLVKTYPKVSETFILREILELEQQGVALHIFALRHSQEEIVHDITSQVKAAVTYAPFPLKQHRMQLLWAHAALGLRRPLRYAQALWFALRRHEPEAFEEWSQAGYLAWVISRMKVRRLHAHFINKAAGVAELVHLLLDMPYSVTAHAKDIYLSEAAVLDRKMRRAEFVITCTEYNRRLLQEISTSETPIYRIYHGLDPARFSPPATRDARADSNDDCPMILSVGRLRPKKGFLGLLEACRMLRDAGYRFCCDIVGYGPQEDKLRTRIRELELDGVATLRGTLSQEALIAEYRRATLFVLPCQIAADGDRDGIPNVLIEAMAMELPVISTTASSIPELVQHRRNGLLAPPETPRELAAMMQQLLDDAALRRQLGRAGRETVCRHFASAHNTEAVKALLLGCRNPEPPDHAEPMREGEACAAII